MLNKNLIDKKDIRIAALERTIESFKKYDKERKAYYKDSMEKLGKLESLLFEIEENDDRKQQIILNQRRELDRLNLILKSKNLEKELMEIINDDDPENEELKNLKYIDQIIVLRKRNKKLNNENKKLKDTISKLLTKLNQKELE